MRAKSVMSASRSLSAAWVAGPSRPSLALAKSSAATAARAGAAAQVPCPRCIATSSALSAGGQPQRDGNGNGGRQGGRSGSDRNQSGDGQQGRRGGNSALRPRTLPPFEVWVKSKDAEQFRTMPKGPGPHWLGDTPFPMNPYFQPPPPIGHRLRSELWKLHKEDPKRNTVRALSARFNIGLDRVLAILRLKALEEEMTSEGKPLQTAFQSNMDRILGASDRAEEEPAPVAETSSKSSRSTVLEDFPEGESVDSALEPALKAAGARSALSRKGLPTGAPDFSAQRENATHNRRANAAIESAPKSSSTTTRPKLRIVETGGKSYAGAHTLERNERRAAKRRSRRDQVKEGASAAAAASVPGHAAPPAKSPPSLTP